MAGSCVQVMARGLFYVIGTFFVIVEIVKSLLLRNNFDYTTPGSSCFSYGLVNSPRVTSSIIHVSIHAAFLSPLKANVLVNVAESAASRDATWRLRFLWCFKEKYWSLNIN